MEDTVLPDFSDSGRSSPGDVQHHVVRVDDVLAPGAHGATARTVRPALGGAQENAHQLVLHRHHGIRHEGRLAVAPAEVLQTVPIDAVEIGKRGLVRLAPRSVHEARADLGLTQGARESRGYARDAVRTARISERVMRPSLTSRRVERDGVR